MPYLLFILVSLIWGTSFAFMRGALHAFGYMQVSMLRALAGTAVLALLWVAGRRKLTLGRWGVGPLVFLAFVGYAVPYAIQPYVIREVDAAVGRGSSFMGLVTGLVPLFTVVVQAVMMRIWPTPREWVGVLGGLALLTFLAWDEVSRGAPAGVFLLAACTPMCYAIGNTYVKHRFHDASPLALTTSAMGLATFMLLPLSVSEGPVNTQGRLGLALVCVVVLGIVCTGLGFYLFYKLIHLRGPLFAGMVGYIIPSVALVIGAILQETITWVQAATLVGVFVMVAIAQYQPAAAKAEIEMTTVE